MTRPNTECPGWLDDDACREWRSLEASGLVQLKEPGTVAAYCFTLALWRKMCNVLDRLGETGSSGWMTRGGQERSHPAVGLEARLAADLLELSEALDLEPIGREAPKPSRVIFVDEGA
jgi:phage terminase small subunit